MGEFVRVSGRKFEVISSGSRPPSVVFESEVGRGADGWVPVLELIDPEVSTFACSRAGQGQSDAPAIEGVIGTNGEAQVASAA